MTKAKKSPISSIKLPDGKVRLAIIHALLKDSKSCHWGLEMKMLNKLLKEHNDPEFWFFFAKRYKFVTLIHLMPQFDIIFATHLEYIKQKSLTLPEATEVVLQKEKIG